jgi:hypothetical protein
MTVELPSHAVTQLHIPRAFLSSPQITITAAESVSTVLVGDKMDFAEYVVETTATAETITVDVMGDEPLITTFQAAQRMNGSMEFLGFADTRGIPLVVEGKIRQMCVGQWSSRACSLAMAESTDAPSWWAERTKGYFTSQRSSSSSLHRSTKPS